MVRSLTVLNSAGSSWAAEEGQDFIADHNSSNVDFATIHCWPDNWKVLWNHPMRFVSVKHRRQSILPGWTVAAEVLSELNTNRLCTLDPGARLAISEDMDPHACRARQGCPAQAGMRAPPSYDLTEPSTAAEAVYWVCKGGTCWMRTA